MEWIMFGYYMTTFENSLGNISTPSMGFLKSESPRDFIEKIRVSLVYTFWFIMQITLLVILLNFVIALISQHYEDVMNRRVMWNYIMKHDCNSEYYVFH